MIHWQSDAVRRAALTDNDLLALSASSESGYSVEVVRAFLDNLPQPPQWTAPPDAPKIVYAAAEIVRITSRHPQLFGVVDDPG